MSSTESVEENGGRISPYVASNPLFDQLAAEDLRNIERALQFRSYSAGRILYSPGESGETVFFLSSGDVRLFKITPTGRRVVIDMLSPGAVFGEMALIADHTYDTFAEAVENCTVGMLSRRDIEDLTATKPIVAFNLLEVLGRRLLVAEEVIERLAHPAIPARVASLLLTVVDDNGEVIGLSHGDLADRCGVRRETTTRALNELRTSGAIELARERIRILDVGKLRAIAAAE